MPRRTTFLPVGFERALRRLRTPPVTVATLTRRLAEDGLSADPRDGPFIKSQELRRRYGFPLPRDVVALLELADRFLIDDVSASMPSFRYVRVAPGGWELPAPVASEPFVQTVARRFEWNAFSNLQLWEHFAGVLSLGCDQGDNRYFVATVHPRAPVFWMDHETAELSQGAVASSLERFLQVQAGEGRRISPVEQALITAPAHWDRKAGEPYLPADGPLVRWPPFLAARSAWLVACAAFGAPEQLDRPEIFAFDPQRELPLTDTNEALALYWTLRAFALSERDVFDEVAPRARTVSPLARSLVELCADRWAGKPATSGLVKLRKRLTRNRRVPRTPRWTTIPSPTFLTEPLAPRERDIVARRGWRRPLPPINS